MTDIPILFKPDMAAAIYDGRKTQTRRMATRAQPGDRLWIKEVHHKWGRFLQNGMKSKFEMEHRNGYAPVYFDNNVNPHELAPDRFTLGWHKRTPLFMEKRYARKWLLVTSVHEERLHDISEDDAISEGIDMDTEHAELCLSIQDAPYSNNLVMGSAVKTVFRNLWDSINGASPAKCWHANPLVWVVKFEVVK